MTSALATTTTIKNLPLDDSVGFVYSIPCTTDDPEIVFMAVYSMPDFRGHTKRTIWNSRYNSNNNTYEWYIQDVRESEVVHGSNYRIYRQPDPLHEKSRIMEQAGRFIFT